MMAESTNLVVSNGMLYSIPGGSVGLIRSIASRTPLATSSAFEPGSWKMRMLADVEPAARGERVVGLAAEFDLGHVAQVDELPGRRRTSRRCSSNCSGSLSRPSVVTVNWNRWPDGFGGWPTCPAATWTFCRRRAAITSSVVSCAGGELVRVEPDAHRVRADAADHHVADARSRGSARRAASAWRSSTGTARRMRRAACSTRADVRQRDRRPVAAGRQTARPAGLSAPAGPFGGEIVRRR